MTDQAEAKKQVLDEIIDRQKKYHSESSLQQFGDGEEGTEAEDTGNEDPGVCLF